MVHIVSLWYRVYRQGLFKQMGLGTPREGSRRVDFRVRFRVKMVVLGSKTGQNSIVGIMVILGHSVVL
jgi:hypothetical protein